MPTSKDRASNHPGLGFPKWKQIGGAGKPPPAARPKAKATRRKRRDKKLSRSACVAHVFKRDTGCRIGIACEGGRVNGGPHDPHEIVFRSHGGDPCDPQNVVRACRLDHDAVHGVPGKGRWIEAHWTGPVPQAETPGAVWFLRRP